MWIQSERIGAILNDQLKSIRARKSDGSPEFWAGYEQATEDAMRGFRAALNKRKEEIIEGSDGRDDGDLP